MDEARRVLRREHIADAEAAPRVFEHLHVGHERDTALARSEHCRLDSTRTRGRVHQRQAEPGQGGAQQQQAEERKDRHGSRKKLGADCAAGRPALH